MITNASIKPMVITADVGALNRGVGLMGAGMVTLGLLFLMTQLISHDLPALENEVVMLIPSINFKELDEEVKIMGPIIPKNIVQPELKRQPIETVAISIEGLEGINFDKQPVTPEIERSKTIGLPAGMAMVPIAPVFPESMAAKGACGFALVQFDISKTGIPVNVVSVDASHPAFAKNAIRAVKRARYKPAGQGQASVEIIGKQERISFVLEGGC